MVWFGVGAYWLFPYPILPPAHSSSAPITRLRTLLVMRLGCSLSIHFRSVVSSEPCSLCRPLTSRAASLNPAVGERDAELARLHEKPSRRQSTSPSAPVAALYAAEAVRACRSLPCAWREKAQMGQVGCAWQSPCRDGGCSCTGGVSLFGGDGGDGRYRRCERRQENTQVQVQPLASDTRF